MRSLSANMKVMLRRTYEEQHCSVAWTLEVIGERWTLLIVRDALLGVTRFGTFRCRLGIAANVLADRLHRLAQYGIVARSPYQQRPTRYEYQLTPKGEELAVVVLSLKQWGDRHLAGTTGPPHTAYHQECRSVVGVDIRCPHCAETVAPDEIVTTPNHHPPGPGTQPR